jgi:hypothetical protein
VQPLCELPQCWMMSGNKSRGPISWKNTHETATSQSCLTGQRYKGERNYENITTKEREIMRILVYYSKKKERNYDNITTKEREIYENITAKER